jgi:MoxR-like ATPase
VDDKIVEYILSIVFATRTPEAYQVPTQGLLLFGASPRASIGLKLAAKANAFLANRTYVTPHDVKQVGYSLLRHRLRRTYEAEAENISPDKIIETIFSTLPVP